MVRILRKLKTGMFLISAHSMLFTAFSSDCREMKLFLLAIVKDHFWKSDG